MRRALLFAAIVFALAPPGAAVDDRPALAVVSRLGCVERVKLFNREPILFFARDAADPGGALLRGVTFMLYDEGGDPDRAECVRAKVEERPRWGSPPSVFTFPLEDRGLPVGRYRLMARKEGYRPGEVRITHARFGYQDLQAELTDEHYRAAFKIVLEDVTETRSPVPVEVRIEGATGKHIDGRKVRLAKVPHRPGTFASSGTVRLSSRKRIPDKDLPSAPRKGLLKVEPGATLVLLLDGVRFTFPLPLPPENGYGEGDADEDDRGRKRDGVQDPTRPPPPRDLRRSSRHNRSRGGGD